MLLNQPGGLQECFIQKVTLGKKHEFSQQVMVDRGGKLYVVFGRKKKKKKEREELTRAGLIRKLTERISNSLLNCWKGCKATLGNLDSAKCRQGKV